MEKIELFLFGKRLSEGDYTIVNLFTSVFMGWMISLGFIFVKEPGGIIAYVMIYLSFYLLTSIITGKIVALKKERTSRWRVLVGFLLIVVQTGTLLYLYAFRILESKGSLWITVPVSMIILVACMLWMCLYPKHKK